MKLNNIAKKFSALLAAVMCCTVISGTVSAAGKTNETWKEAKAAAGASYNAKYIQLVEKYSAQKSKNTVTFSKSRTKKALDKLYGSFNKKNPQFKITIISEELIVSAAVKKGNIKIIGYSDETLAGMYANSKKATIIAMTDGEKVKMSEKITKSDYNELYDGAIESITETLADEADKNYGIKDSEKGKLFKFKYNDKIYYYEQFGDNGYLLTEGGTIVAATEGGESFCISYSTSVDDSEFTVPKGYKEVK